MTKPRSLKRPLILIGIILLGLFGMLEGALLVDDIPLSAARPPETLKTIEDFRSWKPEETGQGTFKSSGVTYAVMLGPAGRYSASGPSAYLFDENGQFVDWTADMGDFRTVRFGFHLDSGAVRDIRHERR